MQAYWFADGDSYDGIEVTERPDWAFCLDGDTPLVARTDAKGNKWYFLDSNERGVSDAFGAAHGRAPQGRLGRRLLRSGLSPR